jgi:hypothetical protein
MWLDHCVPTPCHSNTAVPRWISFSARFFASLRFINMWLDHCVSTPCDSITAAVPRWISLFFALLDGYVSSPFGSITAVPRWISLSALRFSVLCLFFCWFSAL